MSSSSTLARASEWFLRSGIQQPSGGVSRYYLADSQTWKPVSTEITGYAASIFVWLFRTTGREDYLRAAEKAARFLIGEAWDPRLEAFAFELPPRFTYFFDCGIILRGLIAVWRETQDSLLFEVATTAAHAMIRDFRTGRCHHPILTLPDKRPAAREPRWSREPGCYQLKSALAWWELAQINHDSVLRSAFEDALAVALATHNNFLPGSDDAHAVMDRLHAYAYFLEALLAFLDREECALAYREGIGRVAELLRNISPEFARSDVYAQLLRARLLGMNTAPFDRAAASEEASALLAFHVSSEDHRIDGGWAFGRRNDVISPHINPVSTAFALQALDLWRIFESGAPVPCQPPI